jgi:hypothetical protein
MRSSAVAAHPAHTAAFPAASARLSRTTDMRWIAVTSL